MRRLPAVGIASALAANRSASCGGCKGVPGMESPVGAAPYSVFSFTGHRACRPFQRIEV